MFRQLLFASIVFFVQVAPLAAQVRLAHRMRENSVVKNDIQTRIEQTLVIAGMNTESKVNSQVQTIQSAGTRDAAGKLQVEQRIEGLQVNISGTGFEYQFDSNTPDKEGNSPLEFLRKIHQLMLKQVMVLVYNREHQVEAVEFKDNLFQSLPVEVQNLVRSQLDPDALKKKANEEIGQLPNGPVKVGDTWERADHVDFGGGQAMDFQMRYKYEGPVTKDGQQLDRISIQALDVKYSLVPGAIPLTLKESDLKVTESKGELLFNRELGRTVHSENEMRIKGTIQFEANGVAVPSTLDLKLQSETNVR